MVTIGAPAMTAAAVAAFDLTVASFNDSTLCQDRDVIGGISMESSPSSLWYSFNDIFIIRWFLWL